MTSDRITAALSLLCALPEGAVRRLMLDSAAPALSPLTLRRAAALLADEAAERAARAQADEHAATT